MTRLRTRRRRPTDLTYDNGRTASWESIRQHILKLEPTCRICGAPSVEVDHIWPLAYGGDDRALNLQALCVPCNRRKGNTVDEETASALELKAAVMACLDRALRESDDIDRFLDVLINRAAGWRQWDGYGTPELVAIADLHEFLSILADVASRWVSVIDEVVAMRVEATAP